MRFNITGRGVFLTERLKSILIEKLGEPIKKQVRNFPPDEPIQIRIKKGSRFGYKISFSTLLPGNFRLFAQGRAKKLMFAIGDLREKIKRQVEVYRGKKKKV